MTRSSELGCLEKVVLRRLQRLRNDLEIISGGDPTRTREIYVCHLTVELLNSWSNFARAYYLSGMLCAKRVGGGKIIVPDPRLNENDALEPAILHTRHGAARKLDGSWNRRDEPTWHDPYVLLSTCEAVHFSNLTDLQSAFSTGTRVFVDLPVFRNYFAHRNRRSRLAAENLAPLYGIPATRRPSEILMSRPLGRPQMLFLEWLDDLMFVIHFMCY